MEIWKSVAGYKTSYEVSSHGRVKSLDKLVNNRDGQRLRKGRVLKQVPDRAGYCQVMLSQDNVVTTGKVHRLVAFAFLGTPPHPTAHVNHLNFDKADNRVENLQWCTPTQNHRHAVDSGRLDASVSPRRAKKLCLDDVIKIKAALRRGTNTLVIAQRFNISRATVNRIGQGRIWIRA